MFSEPPNPENKWTQLGDLVQDPRLHMTSVPAAVTAPETSLQLESASFASKAAVFPPSSAPAPPRLASPRACRLLNLSQIGPIYFQFRSIGFIPFNSIFSSATQRS